MEEITNNKCACEGCEVECGGGEVECGGGEVLCEEHINEAVLMLEMMDTGSAWACEQLMKESCMWLQ